MKSFIASSRTAIVALIGTVGGCIWAYKSNWDPEPTILLAVSITEIVAFIIIRSMNEEVVSPVQPSTTQASLDKTLPNVLSATPAITQTQHVNVNVNVPSVLTESPKESISPILETPIKNRESVVELMKTKTTVLFIDDDKNFNVVKILKSNGWKSTKAVTDVKNIELLRDVDIFFVDINGVGKALNLAHEGLDLALMLKQRFPNKKVIIYSANRNSNSFHEAWDKCDFKLEKNALPYQFTNLVEQIAIENYKGDQ